MTALIGAVMIASLIGSLHCAGMCGGIVAICVGVDPGKNRRVWPVHVAYNGGRLLMYTTLGAASGIVGGALDLGGSLFGFQRAGAVVAGALIIAFGLLTLLRIAGLGPGRVKLPGPLRDLFQRGLRATVDRPPVQRALVIGVLTAFLPCGWLYAFVVTAAGTGSALAGAAIMAAFWSGTVPVLAVLGVGVQKLAGPLRRHLPTATAVLVVAVGVATVFGRLTVPAYADGAAEGDHTHVSLDESVERVGSLNASPPPCCRDEH
jgi:sulfite exporter TauE/SafE